MFTQTIYECKMIRTSGHIGNIGGTNEIDPLAVRNAPARHQHITALTHTYAERHSLPRNHKKSLNVYAYAFDARSSVVSLLDAPRIHFY